MIKNLTTMKEIIKSLEENFIDLTEIMKSKEWKFFKFGKGGPYSDVLPHLEIRSRAYDERIQKHFLVDKKNYASFTRLIQLGLSNDSPSELYNKMDEIKRQIRLMKRFVNCNMEGK